MTQYPDLSTFSTEQLLALTLREDPSNPAITEITTLFPTIKELTAVTLPELTKIKGIGPKKAASLLASIELAKRLNTPEPTKAIRSPKDVADLVSDMRYLDREHFKVILLNTKNHVIRIETVSIGTLNSSAVHPREVFKAAIRYSAAGVILVHNHPSGDCSASQQDIDITKRLIEAGEIVGISVVDHVIIGDRYLSFKEKGLI